MVRTSHTTCIRAVVCASAAVGAILGVGTVAVLGRGKPAAPVAQSRKAAPPPRPQVTAASLVGTWEQESQHNRTLVQGVVEHFEDGQLLVKTVRAERETKHSGSWSLAGDVLTVKVGRNSPTQSTLRWLNATQFEAIELRSGLRTLYTRKGAGQVPQS
jgi:uncharacterized protein (TIGR03066 family)